MKPYNSARDRLAELVFHARAGVYDRGLPIGHFTNEKRFAELADLRSETARLWGEKTGKRRSPRRGGERE